MRRFSSFLLIMSGTIFSVFIFLVGLYAMIPGFRELVTGSLGGERNIPVVSGDSMIMEDDAAQLVTRIEEEEEVALSSGEGEVLLPEEEEADENETPERLIIDKQYHEDCGTGEGYWVITFDDGTTEIEQN